MSLVERGLSVATAVAGLSAAVVLFFLGPRFEPERASPGDDALAEVDARIREVSAGVQARALTLSQLPRLSWAVGTDPATVGDLTADELSFRPLPGEFIEIGQVHRATHTVLSLLRLPVDASLSVPLVETGLFLVTDTKTVFVASVMPLDSHESPDRIRGALAVAQRLDSPSLTKSLTSMGVTARFDLAAGSVSFGSSGAVSAPNGIRTVALPLKSPASHGLALNLSLPADPEDATINQIAAVAVAALALFLAGLLWRRGRRALDKGVTAAVTSPASATSEDLLAGDTQRSDREPAVPSVVDLEITGAMTPVSVGVSSKTLVGVTAAHSGHSGQNGTSGNDNSRTAEEFHSLFREFVDLRRTCNQTTDIDREAFVKILANKRAEMIKEYQFKHVRFWVIASDGKAVIRSRGTL